MHDLCPLFFAFRTLGAKREEEDKEDEEKEEEEGGKEEEETEEEQEEEVETAEEVGVGSNDEEECLGAVETHGVFEAPIGGLGKDLCEACEVATIGRLWPKGRDC